MKLYINYFNNKRNNDKFKISKLMIYNSFREYLKELVKENLKKMIIT